MHLLLSHCFVFSHPYWSLNNKLTGIKHPLTSSDSAHAENPPSVIFNAVEIVERRFVSVQAGDMVVFSQATFFSDLWNYQRMSLLGK